MINKSLKIFLKNFFNLSLNQGTNILVAVVVTPIIYQTIGDSNYGFVRLAFSISIIFSIIISYGYHLNGPKKISLLPDIESKQNLINEIISIRLILALITSITLIIFIVNTDYFEGYRLILILSLSLLFGEALNPIFYLQGNDNISVYAIVNAISKLLYLFLILNAVNNPSDTYLINFFFGLTMFLVNLTFWINIFYKNRSKITFKIPLISKFKFRLKENFSYFLSSVGGHISIHGSLVILENFTTQSDELGKFALAHRVAFFFRKIPVFIVQSILQRSSVQSSKNNFHLDSFVNYFYMRGIFISLLCAIFLNLTSKWIIVYLSGEVISYSAQILNILSFVPFFATLNIKNLVKILVYDKKDVLNISTWLSSFVMIILSIILTNYYGGLGLAYAILISELLSFIIHTILLSKSDVSK